MFRREGFLWGLREQARRAERQAKLARREAKLAEQKAWVKIRARIAKRRVRAIEVEPSKSEVRDLVRKETARWVRSYAKGHPPRIPRLPATGPRTSRLSRLRGVIELPPKAKRAKFRTVAILPADGTLASGEKPLTIINQSSKRCTMFVLNIKSFSVLKTLKQGDEIVLVKSKKDLAALLDGAALRIHNNIVAEKDRIADDTADAKAKSELWELLQANAEDFSVEEGAKRASKGASAKQAAREGKGKKKGKGGPIGEKGSRHEGSRKEKVWSAFQGVKKITLAEVAKKSGYSQDEVMKSFRLLVNPERCGNRPAIKFEMQEDGKTFKAA